MKLDYIYHSGFAIEADGITVIIDYYKDSSEEAPDRGIVHDHLLKKPRTLYVLSSHFHPDHFNRDILSWKEQRPDIRYIFSKDILKHRRATAEDAVYINKGDVYEDENIRIEAFGSTDVGGRRLACRDKNPATKGSPGRYSHVSGGQPHRKRLHARCGTVRGTDKNRYICTYALQ